jgi:dTDP-4-amino-4,6-dideoxygalactose transaminase
MVPFVPGFEKLQPFLKRIDSKKVYSNFGLLNEELIEKLASYFSIPEEFIATCANATLAITGAVLSSGSPKETEWECPSWTFTATASAIIQSGQALRFRDVDIEGRVIASEGCKALVDVLPFGETFSYDRLPKNINFYVVDAAASFDALRNISFPKNLDVGIVVSMHATKLLPAGEGGIFISNNPQWVSQFKSWTNFGMLGNGDRTSYTVGGNAKLSEYSAAVALASFNDWQITRELVLNQSKKAIALSNFYNL